MSEKDYAPLSVSCVRSLTDKLYEKRKVAALEIERMVKEFIVTNNVAQIKRILKVLGQDFALAQNPNARKGGLIGLAATAIALGKESTNYVPELVKPVLTCFFDSDSRVRYYGCESLYNIVKVARGAVLPHFNDIFDGLSKLSADPDQNVRSGSELLCRLMKDIVTESCAFDLGGFIPLLRERIYTLNPYSRQFIVSWVVTLHDVPDIDMLVFLPEILDGLFQILGDQNAEIRKIMELLKALLQKQIIPPEQLTLKDSNDNEVCALRCSHSLWQKSFWVKEFFCPKCEAALGEFLKAIEKSPQRLKYPDMVNILITHSQSSDKVIKFTAITWLKQFVAQSGRVMLPYASGILTATLPCLSFGDDSRNTREAAKAVNNGLMALVGKEDDATEESVSESTQETKDEAETKSPSEESEGAEKDSALVYRLDLPPVVAVLMKELLHESMQTRIASLWWIYKLFIKTPNKMFLHVDELFPLLLKTLSDPSDEVVLLDLEVLAEISSNQTGLRFLPKESSEELTLSSGEKVKVNLSHGMNGYFSHFMLSLLKLFSTETSFLEGRGSFIIRQLCLLLNAEDIYRCCSEVLVYEEDTRFAAHMIQSLSTILLTSTELFELRTQLKDLKTQESCSLFCCLYKSWCHNPVATVGLCFLTQNYQHASQLLTLFGDLEVTVEFLHEIDKLVQLIESPIFTFLRLQLLDAQQNVHLVRSLYGLLMLLPQSDAFRTLQHRLQCVPSFHFLPADQQVQNSRNPRESRPLVKQLIKFPELLEHFQKVQANHRASRRQPRSAEDIIKKYS